MFSLSTYKKGDAIEFSWHIDDVKFLDDSLTDQECREILKAFEHHHDGSMQSMWDDLQYHTDNFKEEKEVNNEKTTM